MKGKAKAGGGGVGAMDSEVVRRKNGVFSNRNIIEMFLYNP